MILTLLIAYFLGSIPFGLLLMRAAGYGDVRTRGSGNIGATNVLRTGNKKLGAATLLADGLKGAAAVLVARQLAPAAACYALVTAILGHVFPVWLKFKGGKGVATYLGALTALVPSAGIITVFTWLGVFASVRMSALAALSSIGLSPLLVWLTTHDGDKTLCTFLMAALIFYTHRSNIARMRQGTELGFDKSRTQG